MTQTINDLIDIKNELNRIVNLRKETLAKIASYKKTIEQLETEIKLEKENNPKEEILIQSKEEMHQQLSTIVHALSINLENHVYNIDSMLTEDQKNKYNHVYDSVSKLTKMYTQKDDKKHEVVISTIELEYIQCEYKALKFETADRNLLLIYPTIAMVEDEQNSFYIVPIRELNIEMKKLDKKNLEQDNRAQKKMNQISLFIPTVYDEVFFTEEEELVIDFEKKYISYINFYKSLIASSVKGIKKEYFQLIHDFGNKYFEFINKISTNESFHTIVKSDKLTANDVSLKKYIETLGLIDLLKCFNSISDITNTSSNESFSIIYLQARFSGTVIEKYEDIIKLNEQAYLEHYKKLLSSISHELDEKPDSSNDFFILAELLLKFDKETYNEYLSNIYQYASLVIKADGKVTKLEEDRLKKIMNHSSEIKLKKVLNKTQEEESEKTLTELLYDLYDLTGLQTVKQEINTLINVIRVKKAREDFDLKNTDMSMHIVFSGNPGTGKTTIARHLAKIYKCIGLLQKGHLIETDRSGMIAEYVGQTAIKVNKLVDSALGGVLFIDEAYAILIDDKDTYGKEAIATLLKRMEDNRDQLVVVLAGYTDQMATFIMSNPGLKSRFNKYIDFPDYTSDELYSIFIGMSRKLHFKLENSLPDKLIRIFEQEIAKGDTSFGNGRFVRNIFEKMLENQANRLSSDVDLTKEKLTTLTSQDLPIF